MTKNIGITHTHKNSKLFSGEISIEDFNTYYPNKNRIKSQTEALNIEKELKIRRDEKKETDKIKNMTLEELREMKIISDTNGRPLSTLTDEKWQKEFKIRKLFITPYPDHIKKFGGKYSKETVRWFDRQQQAYHGCTNYQQYCSYINDVLKNIRSGQIDYCYFIYQIEDLLKFHYDDLKTKYCDGYWEIWLEK